MQDVYSLFCSKSSQVVTVSEWQKWQSDLLLTSLSLELLNHILSSYSCSPLYAFQTEHYDAFEEIHTSDIDLFNKQMCIDPRLSQLQMN